MFCASILVAAFLGGPLPESPSFYPQEPEAESAAGHAVTQVRADVGWVGPSQTFFVIVSITPDPGWHVYWKNPGASGAPTEVHISAPEGFVVGEAIYPRPSIFRSPEGPTYGYNKEAAIFIPVTAPDTLVDGKVDFSVETNWLACKKNCVLGNQVHTLSLSTNDSEPGPKHKDMQLSRWFSALPIPLEDLQGGKCSLVGSTLHISGETSLRPIRFIGVEQPGVRFGNPSDILVEQDSFRLPVPVLLNVTNTPHKTITIEGLLMLGRKNTDASYVVRIEVDTSHNHHNSRGNNDD